MKLITKAGLIVLFMAIAIVGDGLFTDSGRAAAETPRAVAQAAPSPAATPQPIAYNYIAQPGDSYTLMARKAAQTYGKKFNLKLSLAQIIYIETQLTQAAGSPYLDSGEAISIAEATVKTWVDKAEGLGTDELAGWEYYVAFVDFNTDNVGVSHQ